MHGRPVISREVFRHLCLLTALANAGGNLFLLLFYRPLFAVLGVPLPQDLASFLQVCALSFTVGVLAFLVFLDPDRNRNLLIVGIVGKGLYALATFSAHAAVGLHWFYLAFAVWDAAYTGIFFLFLIQLLSADLTALNRGGVEPGAPPPSTRRALLLHYSLTGNGRGAMARVRTGLLRGGYAVDEVPIVPQERLFRFPFTLGEFVRIMIRAILRRPAAIEPLPVAADHPYDLVVVASQTWFVGMSAPVEAVFQSEAGRRIFAGRDAAAVIVCRGLWRRSQAMLVRHLQASGATVVGTRAYANPGWEPARTFSLFLFLAFGEPGRPRFLGHLLQPQMLNAPALLELERFGERLAARQGPGGPASTRVGAPAAAAVATGGGRP